MVAVAVVVAANGNSKRNERNARKKPETKSGKLKQTRDHTTAQHSTYYNEQTAIPYSIWRFGLSQPPSRVHGEKWKWKRLSTRSNTDTHSHSHWTVAGI